MNGNSFLLDTNIALYILGGNATISEIVDGAQLYVSFITQLELLGYRGITSKEQDRVQRMLDDCIIIDLNEEIRKRTIAIKQNYAIKLPDSIIAATALYLEVPLIT